MFQLVLLRFGHLPFSSRHVRSGCSTALGTYLILWDLRTLSFETGVQSCEKSRIFRCWGYLSLALHCAINVVLTCDLLWQTFDQFQRERAGKGPGYDVLESYPATEPAVHGGSLHRIVRCDARC